MSTEQAVRATNGARSATIGNALASTLAATEYDRVVTVFDSLTPDQWALPTDCPGWDVRAMAGHMLGMAQMVATVPELVRQQIASQRLVKRTGAVPIDALTGLQVAKNASLSTTDLVRQMRAVAPRAVRGRRRIVAALGNRRLPEAQVAGGVKEWWTFGYLFDTILTRDPFMHRVDISQASGVPMQVTADHEGVLVDDVVHEWAGRHGQPFDLVLEGPAGGTWGDGDAAPITMDALEFCRRLAGRGEAPGLLATQVPF